MAQLHNIPEIFGITDDTVGQDIVVAIDDVTYEGRLAAIDGANITLEDCYPTAASNTSRCAHGRYILTLTSSSQVWLDLHEDNFVVDATGAVTLP